MKAICVLLLLLGLAGCAATQASQPAPLPAQNYQRFVPTNVANVPGGPWPASVALDTKTGHLCFTYMLPPKNSWSGTLPLCYELYRQDNSGVTGR